MFEWMFNKRDYAAEYWVQAWQNSQNELRRADALAYTAIKAARHIAFKYVDPKLLDQALADLDTRLRADAVGDDIAEQWLDREST